MPGLWAPAEICVEATRLHNPKPNSSFYLQPSHRKNSWMKLTPKIRCLGEKTSDQPSKGWHMCPTVPSDPEQPNCEYSQEPTKWVLVIGELAAPPLSSVAPGPQDSPGISDLRTVNLLLLTFGAMIRYPDQSNSKKKEFVLDYSFRRNIIHWGRQQEFEASPSSCIGGGVVQSEDREVPSHNTSIQAFLKKINLTQATVIWEGDSQLRKCHHQIDGWWLMWKG